MRLVAVLLCLFDLSIKITYSQFLYSVSSDGRFLASLKPFGDTVEQITITKAYGLKENAQKTNNFYLIEVFDLDLNKKIQSVRFKSTDGIEPDSLVLGPHAQNFYVRFGFHYYVFHTQKGIVAGDYYYPSTSEIYRLSQQKKFNPEFFRHQQVIAFPDFDNVYLVRQSATFILYDAITGKQLGTFTGFAKSAPFKNIRFSSDDNYIVAADKGNRFYLWKNGQSKILKRVTANQVAISADNKKFYSLKSTLTGFALTVSSLPDVKQTVTLRKHQFFKAYPPPIHQGRKIIIDYPKKNESYYFRLSPSGKYLMVGFDYNRLSDMYMIFDTEQFGLKGSFEDRKYKRRNVSIEWINDFAVEVNESDKISRIYSLPGMETAIVADYTIPEMYFTPEIELKRKKDIQTNNTNTLRNFIVFPFAANNKEGFILKNSTSINQESVLIRNYQFVSFSPDGKSVIIVSTEGKPLKTEIKKLFETNGIPVNFVAFDDNIATKTEDWIETDGNPPAGYNYYPLDSVTGLGKLTQQTQIQLVNKSISFIDSAVALDLHLLDNNGFYYQGAATSENKDIWCGLFIRKSDNSVEEIKEFTVEEHTGDSMKNAVAVIMDHSGSLGMFRAFEIEKGVKSLIHLKNKNDAMALVKYDHFIGIESFLTDNSKALDTLLLMNGIEGYGGSTALLDAINTGISLIKNVNGFDRKAILILTDGMENSSVINRQELLRRAMENNISIYTIGFGDLVDDEYLQALSATTGGSYYRIYNTRDLRWIFNDIYRKLNNYYTIRFKNQTPGRQELIIKVCINKTPPLVVEFDNTELPPYETLDTAKYELKIPVITIETDSIILQQPDVVEKLEQKTPINIFRFSTDSITMKEDFEIIEFPNIKFEFDKTVIIPGTDHGIENVTEYLKKYPLTKIEITGHTDSIGSIEYNIDLSIRRAEKIKTILVEQGIKPDRILIKGSGETSPATRNKDFWGRTYNRRVEFRLILPR